MLVKVDKGEKIKIQEIDFVGNEKVSDKALRSAMKDTKQKNPIRLLKSSKFIKDKYKTDLEKVIAEL